MFFIRMPHGYSDVEEYIEKLRCTNTKDAKINLKKITAYFDYLEEFGQKAKEPYVKKITDELWELRPIKNRFMFAYIKDSIIVVLTHFYKSTQETPKNEILKAEKRLKKYKERGDFNGYVERT